MPQEKEPTKAQVLAHVIGTISGFTLLQPSIVQDRLDRALRAAPFSFDNDRLRSLAMSLRGYVRRFHPDGRLLSSDVRKSGLTVRGLADLVHSRIHANDMPGDGQGGAAK